TEFLRRDTRCCQPTQGSAGRFTHSQVSARQAHGMQVKTPLETPVASDQYFPAPNATVRAETSAVENQPNGRFAALPGVFCKASRQVGVMMLNFYERKLFFLAACLRVVG